MNEVTFIYEDFEAEAIHEAYEVTCQYLQELGEDIDNYSFDRFVLMAIIDKGLESAKALRSLIQE
jgi:hypothetical protein